MSVRVALILPNATLDSVVLGSAQLGWFRKLNASNRNSRYGRRSEK